MPSLNKERLSAAVQHHGPLELAALVRDRLKALAYLDEDHVWYVLELSNIEGLAMPPGYTLRQARSEDDVRLAATLPGYRADVTRARLADANQVWLVTAGDEAAFACSIFFGSTPVLAAAQRSLSLPPGVACLEASVTAEPHRGHGIAGAAWTAISKQLRTTGIEVLITKVEVENVPSRRAVNKAGFVPARTMHFRRRGLREHVAFDSWSAELGDAGEQTAQALERLLVR
jgi:GNAT superfamily N-acetyltransferase